MTGETDSIDRVENVGNTNNMGNLKNNDSIDNNDNIDNVEDVNGDDDDDLFGDDDEDDDDIDNDNGNNEDGDEEDQKSRNEENDANSELDVEEDIKEAEVTLERHPRSHKPLNDDAYSFPLPRFLYVEPTPFTPNLFEEDLKEFIRTSNQSTDPNEATLRSSIQFKKLQLINTIRWRYSKDNEGNLFKQSNANIIEWDDGSMSLKLGNEYFDIKTKPLDDNILSVQNGETVMSLQPLNKSIQVLPPSMKSKAHVILANTISKNLKAKKSKTINTIVTSEDPELRAREISKAQREIEKARRRQAMKLELQEQENERRSMSASLSIGGRDEANVDDDIDVGDDYDDYDEEEDDEDDIVHDEDEDELDRAEARLKQVKKEGAAKYRDLSTERDDDVDEDLENRQGGSVRKKRKLVFDEDDE